MPTALPKSDRLAHWVPRPGQDSGSLPCPLYSGHLLKLGSNDRWQSRLFTFDGSVLICVGKKPKAPVIMTYDPYVSSPFQSPSCHPRPLNPNTKWYINIASITALKLMPVTARTHRRCFPNTDTSKELSIQTKDGRNINLRASKDLELERWYFILSKIWELHQQLEHPGVAAGDDEEGEEIEEDEATSPCATKNLAAHQQSAQLFQRYLQKQYNHNQQEGGGAESPLHEQQLHQQPPAKSSPFHHLRPQQKKKPRESFLPYEIPPPPRVSAFLPQGFEWSLQEQGDEDDIPVGYSNNFRYTADDSRSTSGGGLAGGGGDQEHRLRRPMERQSSWSHQKPQQQQQPLIQGSTSMNVSASRHASVALTAAAGEVLHSASAEMYHQRYTCPAPAMEPGKAAIIDNWRRSLHLPLLVDATTASPPHEDESIGVSHQQHVRARTIAIDHDLTDLADLEEQATALKRLSLGLDMAACNNIESGGLHSATVVPSPITDLIHWGNIPHDDYSYAKSNTIFAHQHHQDDVVKDLAVNNRASEVAKEEDELPLGLLQSNRHSRWLNTQLSSEDGASNAPRQAPATTGHLSVTTTHQLLPSEPITPERTPAKSNSSALNQLDSLAPANRDLHHQNYYDSNNNSTSYYPITTNSSKLERAPFTVHVPVRQLRRCPSIPPSSVVVINNNDTTTTTGAKSKKYVPIDITPYTAISSSLPHYPPPRPPRPPSVGFNSLAGPDDLLNSHTNAVSSLRSTNKTSPPIPPPANYKKPAIQHKNRLSLSKSISAKSNLTLQHPAHLDDTKEGDGDDEDEDEPLAMTLTRQQSLRQRRSQLLQQQQQQLQSQSQQVPMPALPLSLSFSHNQTTLPVDTRPHLQCYEQVTPAASSESVSYY
ncbi:hypothetical protein EC991_002005 [Linnemannia zychae]|nr:hypothetical protein EC991_002005 [Linnemannia zychae]